MRALVLGNAPPRRDVAEGEPPIARQMRLSGVSSIEPANRERAAGFLRTTLGWN